jgi:hypothetical protein
MRKRGLLDGTAVAVWLALMLPLLGLTARPVLAHVRSLTDADMIQMSDHIVVAVVERRETHWNRQHTLIVTDYTLSVEDRLKGSAPERITVTVAGGTIGEETHGTCLSVELEPGARYALFLGSLEKRTVSPFTGAWQGIFQELRQKNGASAVAAGPGRQPLTVDGVTVRFEDFIAAVRDLAARVQANPAPPVEKNGERPFRKLPAKAWDPSSGLKSLRPVEPLAAPPGEIPPPPSVEREKVVDVAGPSLRSGWDSAEPIRQLYSYQYRPPAPIVFDQFPRSFFFSPHDEYQMSFWNTYASNLFRVSRAPSDTWAFGNGIFELAGFPDNDDMRDQFGNAWEGSTLGVTYSRVVGGRIIEADVALNPAFDWTLDSALATRQTSRAFSFQHTMLHELGHAWGLKHPWETQDVWWDSVMNYSDKQFHIGQIKADDAQAVRAAYPGTKLRDMLVNSYVTGDTPGSFDATYVPARPSPSVVSPGSTFNLTGSIKIENLGTVRINNPSIEVYLTPQPFSFTGSIYLGTLRYRLATKPWSIHYLNTGTLTVPRGAPRGTYYVAFFIRDRADRSQHNNSAWTNATLTIQ